MRSPIEEQERRMLFGGRESLDASSHIFVKLRLTPAQGLSLEEAAARVLLITTLRTMRRLPYESAQKRVETAGMITDIDSSGFVEIALPMHYVSQREGLTHLLLLITTASEYNYTETFWIENVELPEEFIKRYKGPRFGVKGIRNLFQVYDRPLVGLILKPRVGVPISELLKVAEAALTGGADFIADDLLLVDPDGELEFCSRINRFSDLARKVADKTGEKKFYFANIGISAFQALDYAHEAIKAGVGAVIVDAFTMGIGGVEYIVHILDGKIPVISTNMGAGIMTRGSLLGSSKIFPTGISDAVVAKLNRIAGVDAIHYGTSASECYGENAWGPAYRAGIQKIHGLETSMAVAEGDLNIVNLWDNIRSLGRDLLIEPTSGIINYPGGAAKGAEAFRLLATILLPEMSEEEAHSIIQNIRKPNFRQALKYFEYNPPGNEENT